MNMVCKALMSVLVAALFSVAYAGPVTIDFEGLKNLEQIQNYYAGGAGSMGSKGPNYNITFSGPSLALIDSDDGGAGNIANEKPPGNTVGFFLDDDKLVMNVADGFSGGFSFWYSSIDYAGKVVVYPNPDAQGHEITTLDLEALGSDANGGDPNGNYNRWAQKSVSFNGVAKSIAFMGVANYIVFDLITLSPTPPSNTFDVSLNLDKIIHTEGATTSNAFSIYFKDIKSKTEDITKLCSNFFFKVAGDKGRGATYLNCNYSDPNKLVVDFTPSGTETYFENGVVSICKTSDQNACQKIESITNFTVYGTLFDVKKHAFQFKNGSWNTATFEGDFKPLNDIAQATDIAASYLVESDKQTLWDFVGWTKENPWWQQNKTQTSQGLCHGMAFSSSSNFNNRAETSAWGVGGEITTQWRNQIEGHWDDTNHYANKPYSPFNEKDIYAKYPSASDIEADKKIIYYFVTQGGFNDLSGIDWVGDYPNVHSISDSATRSATTDRLKLDFVVPVDFFFTKKGGHAVVVSQYIGYNSKDRWYLYDNSYPGQYGRYEIDDTSDYSITDSKNNKVSKGSSSSYYETIESFVVNISEDTSKLYGDAFAPTKTSQRAAAQQAGGQQQIEYAFPNHSEVSLVGGNFVSVSEAATQIKPVLLPLVDQLQAGKAYALSENVFKNKLYLPYSTKFKVTIRKLAGFAFMKVYLRVPNGSGEVELINYENIQVDQADPTLAYFYVGGGNQDKNVVRENGDKIAQDYAEVFGIKLSPVSSPRGVVKPNGVDLRWSNPVTVNFKEIAIVRKVGAKPADIADGTEVYRGSGESFTDTTASSNAKYFYAFYAVASDGTVADAAYIYVDTYRYSIYGRTVDAQGGGAGDVEIMLLNLDKSSVINLTKSDKDGNYAFNDLTNGTYYLTFASDSYSFANSELAANLSDASLAVDNTATGLPRLFVNAEPIFQVGNSASINWDGKNIGGSETVDVMLSRGGSWETVASGLSFGAHGFKWVVTGTVGSAVIRVSLGSNNAVSAEKNVTILGTASTGTLITRYRLYSDLTKEHLYTTDSNEYSVLPVCCGWLAEGAIYKLFQGAGSLAGVDAVQYYRLYNPFSHQHHWTTDPNEYNVLGTMGWSKEGVDGYILPSAVSGSVPLFRLYLNAFGGLHLWTTDANEKNVLSTTAGWVDEGVAGYVVPLP